jgi:hypothetical protein
MGYLNSSSIERNTKQYQSIEWIELIFGLNSISSRLQNQTTCSNVLISVKTPAPAVGPAILTTKGRF